MHANEIGTFDADAAMEPFDFVAARFPRCSDVPGRIIRVPRILHEGRPRSKDPVAADEDARSAGSASAPALRRSIVLEEVQMRRRGRQLCWRRAEGDAELIMLSDRRLRLAEALRGKRPQESEEVWAACGASKPWLKARTS